MSAATTSSLGNHGHHLGVSAPTTRPRTRSLNTDHTQMQHHQQQQPQQEEKATPLPVPATSPSTAALDQIMSNLSQSQPHHQQHHVYSLATTSPATAPAVPPLLQASSSSGTSFDSPSHQQFLHSSADSLAYSSHQDSLLAMASNSSNSTPPPSKTAFGVGAKSDLFPIPGIGGGANSLNIYSASPSGGNSSGNSIYSSTGATHTGSNSNVILAHSNSSTSLNTLHGNNPLQHRPHTPLKSSFPLSITSEHPSDFVTITPSSSSVEGGGGLGLGGTAGLLSATSAAAGGSFETITTAQTPSLFKSLSTKTGRKHLMHNEKHLGSLPTIHHQHGRGRQETVTVLGVSMKHLSLVVLLLQNSVLVLMMRFSRVSVDPDQPMYLASTAVFLAELIKLCTCFMILVYKTKSVARTVFIIRKEILEQPREILKMLVPSGLYALQNNLLYIALSNLEAATFQVTYQMKILSTAIFSVVMLNRRLTRQKWLSLCLLMVGVTLVQLQNVGTAKSPVVIDTSIDEDGDSEFLEHAMSENAVQPMGQLADGSDEDDSNMGQNPIIGLLAVLTSCVSSGFAGCYFEKILKGSESDMWVRNLQLGISGSLFSFLAMFYDRQKIYEGGIFQGYSTVTWMVITNQALGGLLVAIVVKYADNILKGFATSLSIIISGMISVYFFDFEPSIQFQLGTLVVILATFLYGRPDAPIPRFIRPQKKRQSMPPPLKYAS